MTFKDLFWLMDGYSREIYIYMMGFINELETGWQHLAVPNETN
jgi:hypothetical protein